MDLYAEKPKKPMPVAVETGMCECTIAPMGRGGMEGFTERMYYKYERMMEPGIPSTSWYRVYHGGYPEDYYETCSTGLFRQHFKTVSGTSR